MAHINKPRELRLSIGLTITSAGRQILGIQDTQKAYNTWAKIERDNEPGEHLSNSMRQLLSMVEYVRDNGLLGDWLNRG